MTADIYLFLSDISLVGFVTVGKSKTDLRNVVSPTDCAMDRVLNIADYYIFTPYVYPAAWPEDEALRQIISLWVVTNLGAELIYLGFGALSFYCVFDHKLMKHPQFITVSCLMVQNIYLHTNYISVSELIWWSRVLKLWLF